MFKLNNRHYRFMLKRKKIEGEVKYHVGDYSGETLCGQQIIGYRAIQFAEMDMLSICDKCRKNGLQEGKITEHEREIKDMIKI